MCVYGGDGRGIYRGDWEGWEGSRCVDGRGDGRGGGLGVEGRPCVSVGKGKAAGVTKMYVSNGRICVAVFY